MSVELLRGWGGFCVTTQLYLCLVLSVFWDWLGRSSLNLACNVSSVMSCHIFPHNVFVQLPFKTRWCIVLLSKYLLVFSSLEKPLNCLWTTFSHKVRLSQAHSVTGSAKASPVSLSLLLNSVFSDIPLSWCLLNVAHPKRHCQEVTRVDESLLLLPSVAVVTSLFCPYFFDDWTVTLLHWLTNADDLVPLLPAIYYSYYLFNIVQILNFVII